MPVLTALADDGRFQHVSALLAGALGLAVAGKLDVSVGYDSNGFLDEFVVSCVPCEKSLIFPARPWHPDTIVTHVIRFIDAHPEGEEHAAFWLAAEA